MAKTGTSSIQNSLGQASAALREQGVTCAPWKPFNHSFDFTVLFLEDPRKSFYYKQQSPITAADWDARLQGLREQWIDLFATMETGPCIISAENLTRLSTREIQSLQAFVAPYFDRVRAIAYVRDPLKSLKSQWEQDVKEIQEPLSAQALLKRTKQRMGYRFFHKWRDCLGSENLVVRKFDPAAFHNGSLLDDFFHALGIDGLDDTTVEEMESNQSLGADGTAFLLAFNSRYPQYENGAINPRRGLARRLHLLYQAMRAAGDEPLNLQIRFDEEEAQRFNNKIADLNAFLGEDGGFATVQASQEETLLPSTSAIGTEYYIELVNELARMVDTFATQNEALSAENNRLQASLEATKDHSEG
jgi:hypothetical protein